MIIGNWFMMHLFLAILLKNFEDSPYDEEKERIELENEEKVVKDKEKV
jgi:hypothetical protein